MTPSPRFRADRWDIDAFYDPDPDAPGKMYTRYGGFLDDVDRFDAEFFGISPREAESDGPAAAPAARGGLGGARARRHRAAVALHGTQTGVFVGIGNSDYGRMLFAQPRAHRRVFQPGQLPAAWRPGRLSYVLGLHGPSMAVDTACSSSLVAVHLACQSLRRGECDLALAGGVNLILSPELNINFSKARHDGARRPLQDLRRRRRRLRARRRLRRRRAKRLRDALADGDRVLAVIRGSAVNQDGRSSGLTAPNGPAQEAVIRAALAAAGVAPAQVGYVEAHGTGTSLGDPIEVQALGAVLGEGRDARRAAGARLGQDEHRPPRGGGRRRRL